MTDRRSGARRAWPKGAVAQKGYASKRSPRSNPMNLRTLSRSDRYRLLGMYDESTKSLAHPRDLTRRMLLDLVNI
jgi:hypothetical protein